LLRRYSLSTIETALSRVRAQQGEQTRHFDMIAEFIPRRHADRGEQKRAAAALGMTPGELATQVCRLRVSFRNHLKDVVADTLDIDAHTNEGEEAIAQEIECLIRAFELCPVQVLSVPGTE